MNKIIYSLFFVILFVATLTAIVPRMVGAETTPTTGRGELEQKIQEHTQQLDAVNKQIEAAKESLKGVQQQKTSLQKELTNIDYSIKQLNLNIQSDTISSEKLGFEIDSLSYDLRDIEDSIQGKRDAIGEYIRELQKNDSESTLLIFLKNKTLAEGLSEAQSLDAMRNQLTVDISSLKNLKNQYNDKLDQVNIKKQEIDTHAKSSKNKKVIVEEQKQERQVILTQTKSQESLYQKQLADLIKQQNTISDAIQKIEDQLRASFDPSLLPSTRSGVFLWPVTTPRITQHYGEKSALYRGKPHNGLDIGVSIGTPVFAADDGTVMHVDNNDKSKWNKYQYGRYVLIKHNNNLATIYAHLSQQTVSDGDQVKRGDVIGYSGNTGYATGPHLHFGAYWAPSVVLKSIPPAAGLVPIGVTINPEDYL